MNNASLYAPIVDASITLVQVAFKDDRMADGWGKPYTYKTDLSGLSVGDLVVVEARDHMQVAKVVKSDVPLDVTSDHVYRWVVASLDLSDHEARLERERRLIDHVNQRRTESVRAKMLEAMGLSTSDALLISGVESDKKEG